MTGFFPDHHRCAQCADDAVVGFGKEPEWLCEKHFEVRLASIGVVVRRLRAASATESAAVTDVQ